MEWSKEKWSSVPENIRKYMDELVDPDSGRMGCFFEGEYIPDVKNS